MPGAYTIIDGNIYKIWSCEISNESSDEVPGTIIKSNDKDGLIIKTGDGAISITEIQAPNSKRMLILDYLRGNKI